ncbi:hypothetical protein B0H11DRAFT_1954348 [Mycena galericulata]|nr:hypothetical protein B0H11DRAFT_2071756 [Mycena galericulata]KAJ7511201.1 hypothetical protein B0H11DRAFT_1954348 [Mycena galericulata]
MHASGEVVQSWPCGLYLHRYAVRHPSASPHLGLYLLCVAASILPAFKVLWCTFSAAACTGPRRPRYLVRVVAVPFWRRAIVAIYAVIRSDTARLDTSRTFLGGLFQVASNPRNGHSNHSLEATICSPTKARNLSWRFERHGALFAIHSICVPSCALARGCSFIWLVPCNLHSILLPRR